jgi:hypothetical protein
MTKDDKFMEKCLLAFFVVIAVLIVISFLTGDARIGGH